ncbi:MAG: DUF4124 domain-containing protein [Burkholderiales bacterium]
MKALSLAVGLALCVALPASAQMYKWVDSNGGVHYSDKPPPGNAKLENMRPPAQPDSAPASAEGAKKDAAGPKSLAEQEQAFEKRRADEAKAQAEQAKKDAEARVRAENCQRAKAALTNLELGGRQARIDSKGERVFLSDAEIAQATTQARQEVAAACK